MEDIDGGLHPAVDGQSLDEDEDEVTGMTGPGKRSMVSHWYDWTWKKIHGKSLV